MSDKIKILVADDEQLVRDFLGDLLSSSEFEVLKAENGKSALESLAKDKPDILLLDITMPDMDGFKICETVRSKPENDLLPILMITGDTHESAIVQALQHGADDYITKPFHNEDLINKIQSLLSQAKDKTLPSQDYLKKVRSAK